jgi:hypothetical protein
MNPTYDFLDLSKIESPTLPGRTDPCTRLYELRLEKYIEYTEKLRIISKLTLYFRGN